MANLLIHVPHSSVFIPDHVRDQFLLTDAELELEVLESADRWTDQLADAAWPGATKVVAKVSRLVVDVERYLSDELEVMAAAGRGAFYERCHDGRPLRRTLTTAERCELADTYYHPHWAMLRRMAANKVLIDLHTYPARPWPVEIDPARERPEIDLGTSPSLTPVAWQEALLRHFEAHGFTVGLNTPYAGVVETGATSSTMIEIRRDMLGTGPGCTGWLRVAKALETIPLS
jgi:N-formylglutamate amidohydrolase